jgi:hypothetical protein
MQKRSRRAHGIQSRKISISVSEDDLRVLHARAKRVHAGNVSAVIHDMVATLRREEAIDELLEVLGGDRVSNEEIQAIRDEVAATPTREAPVKRRKPGHRRKAA